MLKYQFRFHGHGSLGYLYRNGKSVRVRRVALRFIANTKRPHGRVAVVVGKKVSKSAVVRNRIRRRVFEVVRTHYDHIKPQVDMAITVFSIEYATMPAEELQTELLLLLKDAGLYQ